MRCLTTLLLCLAMTAAIAACSGGGGTVPAVRDYTSGNSTTHNVRPQSVIARCPPNEPDCVGGGGGGGGGCVGCAGDGVCGTGCTIYDTNYTVDLPSTIDPSTITTAQQACDDVGLGYDSIHRICFEWNSDGTSPSSGHALTTILWGQCSDKDNVINSYDYNAHNAYELWCTAPADPGVSAYNNVWKFYINASGSPLYTGNNNNEPAGKAFPTYVYTSQYYFTEIDMWFAAAPVGTLQWRGGAISVGEV